MANKVYSVLINEYKNDKGEWEKQYNFFKMDLSETSFDEDWRFNSIPNKRKESVFLGTITDPKFPLDYPIYLDNGKVIDKT